MTAGEYRPGSREDFDRLYADSYGRIFRTLLSVLRDSHAAEDCAQEAFIRAFQAWPRWRPDAPAEAWLHRIAINAAVSHRRRERLRSIGLVALHALHPSQRHEESGGVAGDLAAALRKMPPLQASAIVLRFYHGYSNREIATALGVAESTVSSRIAAARQRLRLELGGTEPPLPQPQLTGAPSRYLSAAERSP